LKVKLLIASLVATAMLTGTAQAADGPAKSWRPPARLNRPTLRSLQALNGSSALVQLVRGERGRAAKALIRGAGGRLISQTLRIWLVPPATRSILPVLIRRDALIGLERNRSLRRSATFAFSDPLWQYEWWRSAVGAEAAPPLPAGIPLTILDSGVDVTHPEFQGSHITLLNQQFLGDASDDDHGTAVTSVAAAPANGFGMVGIYPDANVWEWDGRSFTDAEFIAGIDAAIRRGPSVINMSWGSNSYDPLLEEELLVAFGTGSIPVAAAGNEFVQGNPIEYPASFNHVLTVAATDRANEPSYFSNSNYAVDLAAPGENIVVAVPYAFNPNGFDLSNGTSFSAPIVAAATAGVWSMRRNLDNTQMFDLMRFSARDIWNEDYDPDTGFGLLDIPTALSQQAPRPDHSEPNEDIYMVKAGGLFSNATPPLTRPGHGQSTTRARLDYTEDPEDVYRVYVPAGRTIFVRAVGDDDVNIEMWRPGTKSVYERGAAQQRDLIGISEKKGTSPETVAVRNGNRRGGFIYADVFLGKEAASANYSLSVRTSSK